MAANLGDTQNVEMKVLDVEVTKLPQKKDPNKKYEKAVVSYRDVQWDEVKAMTVTEFIGKGLFKKVSELEPGTTYHMQRVMGPNGYWDLTHIGTSPADLPPPASSASTPASAPSRGSNSSTQDQIVRQSSLRTAAMVLGEGASLEALISLSESLNDYVFNGVSVGNATTTTTSDEEIPF